MTSSLPAALGGDPAFEHTLYIYRPVLPPLSTIQERLQLAMETGQLTNHGQHVQAFEAELEAYLGVQNAVAVNSGTSALLLMMKAACDGGEVILPSFTYSATVHAAVYAGLEPVFADIRPDNYTLDVESVARMLNDNTVAILGVHIYGHPCEIHGLAELADAHHVPLMFDSAHAFGSLYDGKKVGGFGKAEAFSFHATKIFPIGEGGAVTTDDDELADTVRLLRNFGDPGTGNTLLPGINTKMQEFNALVGLEALKTLDEHIEHRRGLHGVIRRELADVAGLVFQTHDPRAASSCQNFSVLVDQAAFGLSRDQLAEALGHENVAPRKYFWPPVHQHDAYAVDDPPARDDLSQTGDVADRVLCLPVYSDMREDTVRRLCAAVKRISAHATDVAEALKS